MPLANMLRYHNFDHKPSAALSHLRCTCVIIVHIGYIALCSRVQPNGHLWDNANAIHPENQVGVHHKARFSVLSLLSSITIQALYHGLRYCSSNKLPGNWRRVWGKQEAHSHRIVTDFEMVTALRRCKTNAEFNSHARESMIVSTGMHNSWWLQ